MDLYGVSFGFGKKLNNRQASLSSGINGLRSVGFPAMPTSTRARGMADDFLRLKLCAHLAVRNRPMATARITGANALQVEDGWKGKASWRRNRLITDR